MTAKIPKHWKIKKLGEIGKVKMCKRIFKDQTNKDSNGIPFYKIGTFGGIPDAFISKELYNEYKNKYPYPKKGDVLISAAGTIGRLVVFDGTPSYFQDSNIIWIENDENIALNKYLYHLYSNVKWKTTEGGIVSRLYNADIESLELPIPPLEEQEKIAEILLTCDKAIRLTTQIITQLKQRNQGLAQQLLTGEKSNYKAIGKYIKEISNRNSNLQVKKVLSVTNSKGFINQSEQFGRELASSDVSNYKIVSKGQFAYNPSRVNVGSIDLLQDSEMGILSPMYIVFETKEDYLLSKFLYYHLKSNSFLVRIPTYVQGSVRDTLSFKALSEMEFFIPNIEKQKKVTKILDTAHQELKLYEQKLQLLQAQKKTLMQKLLIGEVLTVKK
jgi:putative type I restriction enzyme specificity protein HI_0216